MTSQSWYKLFSFSKCGILLYNVQRLNTFEIISCLVWGLRGVITTAESAKCQHIKRLRCTCLHCYSFNVMSFMFVWFWYFPEMDYIAHWAWKNTRPSILWTNACVSLSVTGKSPLAKKYVRIHYAATDLSGKGRDCPLLVGGMQTEDLAWWGTYSSCSTCHLLDSIFVLWINAS